MARGDQGASTVVSIGRGGEEHQIWDGEGRCGEVECLAKKKGVVRGQAAAGLSAFSGSNSN